jgi:hypothetical protein
MRLIILYFILAVTKKGGKRKRQNNINMCQVLPVKNWMVRTERKRVVVSKYFLPDGSKTNLLQPH